MSDVTAGQFGRLLPRPILINERPAAAGGSLEAVETFLTRLPWPLIASVYRRRSALMVAAVNKLSPGLESWTDGDLRAEADDLRLFLRRARMISSVTVRAFALIREIARRRVGMRHYDVQLMGGWALLNGIVAEMETGEGKTLVATLAAGTAGLAGIPVHVVTVNDYLAQRDAEIMGPIFEALGLTVGIIVHGMEPSARRAAYQADIVYASNKEIVFDYLRDKVALGAESGNARLKLEGLAGREPRHRKLVMRGLHFAIVDEADSVLIDEARTPLIISRETEPADEAVWAETAMRLVEGFAEQTDFRILKEQRRVELLPEGERKLEARGLELSGVWQSRLRREDAAAQALTARHLFHAGEHYIVRDGKVQIVDEYSGRIMSDRSWNEGLHQLVEIKEGCEVTARKEPMARMSYQRFFRRYKRLAGMTGTAREVAGEMWSVYRLRVMRIPTNRPIRRYALPSRICRTQQEKWSFIANLVADQHRRRGRPVLIGTRSVDASEMLSEVLGEAGIEHVVLNAKQDGEEAEIIADAGLPGRVTVATNMAGRGVDIDIPGKILEQGGLFVILSERHEARRIDRQLFGRCGRNGEPGRTMEVLALDDPVLETFGGRQWLRRLFAVTPALVRFSGHLFTRAQKRAERIHSRMRRDLLKLDRQMGTLLAFTGEIE